MKSVFALASVAVYLLSVRGQAQEWQQCELNSIRAAASYPLTLSVSVRRWFCKFCRKLHMSIYETHHCVFVGLDWSHHLRIGIRMLGVE